MNKLEKMLVGFKEGDGDSIDAFLNEESFKEQMDRKAQKEGVEAVESFLKDIKFSEEAIAKLLYYIKQKQKWEQK